MRGRPVITLITDFGLKDPYVAVMKAVIMSINPEAMIVDVSHEVGKFNVCEASYILLASYKYFPRGTVHVVVVDPGVGSRRAALAIRTKNYIFVGPNNGVLAPAALDDGILEVRVIEEESLFLKPVSTTFHGRDIFVPVAAHLASGHEVSRVGRRLPVEELEVPSCYVKPRVVNGRLVGSIVYVDTFGNLITSIPVSMLNAKYGDTIKVRIRGETISMRYVPSFSYVQKGEPLIYPGSFGFVEIGVNMGSAASHFRVSVGEVVEMEASRRC